MPAFLYVLAGMPVTQTKKPGPSVRALMNSYWIKDQPASGWLFLEWT
jgi:hypothetical protein